MAGGLEREYQENKPLLHNADYMSAGVVRRKQVLLKLLKKSGLPEPQQLLRLLRVIAVSFIG